MGNAAMQMMDVSISNEAPKTIEEIGDRTFRVKERMWSWNTVANLPYIWCKDMLNGEGKHKESKYYYPMAFLEELKQLEARKVQLTKEKGENLEADIKSLDDKISEFKGKQCTECVEKAMFRLDKLHDTQSNDCLCLASGPSVLDNGKVGADGKTLEFTLLPKAEKALKRYSGTIVVADRSLIPCLKAGIVPKYVVSADGVDHVVDYFRHELVEKAIKEHGIMAIFNTQIHPLVSKQWTDYGGKIMWYSVALDALHQAKSLSRYLFHMTNDTVVSVPWGNCLSPTSEVVTKNGLNQIQNIQINEDVLSQDGWVPTLNKFIRHYKGKMIKITPSNLNIQCELTPEHRVLTRRFSRSWERPSIYRKTDLGWKRADKLERKTRNTDDGDYLVLPRLKQTKTIDKIDLKPLFEKEIASGEIVCENGSLYRTRVTPILQGRQMLQARVICSRQLITPEYLVLSEPLLEFIGWYISEGCLFQYKKSTKLEISNTNPQIINRIEKSIQNIGFPLNYTKYTHKNRPENRKDNTVISISNSVFINAIKHMFGKGANNKHFPEWIFDLDEKQIESMLRGMYLGDGSKIPHWNNIDGFRISYTTNSRTLALQLWQLLTRFGWVGNFEKYPKKDAYKVIVNVKDGELENISTWKEGSKLHYRIDDDYVYLGIKNIEELDYDGKVYDLQTNGSFCSPFIVHNCGMYEFGLSYLIGYNPIILYGFDFGFAETDKIEDTPYFNPYYKATCLEFIAKELGVSMDTLTKLDKNSEKFKKACEKYFYDDAHEYKSTSKIHPEVREATIKNHFHYYTNPFGNRVYHDNIFKAYKDIALSFFVSNPHAQIINCSDYTSLFADTCELCKGNKKVNKEVEEAKECYKCHVKHVNKSKGELIDCWRCRKIVGKNEKGEPIYESTGIQANNIKCMELQDYISSKLVV